MGVTNKTDTNILVYPSETISGLLHVHWIECSDTGCLVAGSQAPACTIPISDKVKEEPVDFVVQVANDMETRDCEPDLVHKPHTDLNSGS